MRCGSSSSASKWRNNVRVAVSAIWTTDWRMVVSGGATHSEAGMSSNNRAPPPAVPPTHKTPPTPSGLPQELCPSVPSTSPKPNHDDGAPPPPRPGRRRRGPSRWGRRRGTNCFSSINYSAALPTASSGRSARPLSRGAGSRTDAPPCSPQLTAPANGRVRRSQDWRLG